MNEIAEKEQAQRAMDTRLGRREKSLGIEQVEGGFIVTRITGSGLYASSTAARTVVPNADCLASLVLKWAGETTTPE
jgi:hypothetical protein